MFQLEKNARENGFTLLEFVVVIFIMAMMAFFVASTFSTVTDNAAVNTAIEEMYNIKKSITDFFYPDLGIVPQDFGEEPEDPKNATRKHWFATRFLCIQDDRPGM
ncbi:MAG: type II secretion system protein [Desulfosarcina sp.]|nr:type II secretion system protein [Desulfobacterales bacterium]